MQTHEALAAEGVAPVEPESVVFPLPSFEAYGERLHAGDLIVEWSLDIPALYKVQRRGDALRAHGLFLAPWIGVPIVGVYAVAVGQALALVGALAFVVAWAFARPWLTIVQLVVVSAAGAIAVPAFGWPLWLALLPVALLIPACVGATLIRDAVLDASTHSPVLLRWLMDRGSIRFPDDGPEL